MADVIDGSGQVTAGAAARYAVMLALDADEFDDRWTRDDLLRASVVWTEIARALAATGPVAIGQRKP